MTKAGRETGQIVVQVLEKQYELGEFKLDLIPKPLFQWEYGGWQDPVGQLGHWLWGLIDDALSWMEINIVGKIWSARDYIWDKIKDVPSAVASALNYTLNLVKNNVGSILNVVNSITNTLGGFFNNVYNSLTTLGGTLGGISAFLTNIYNAISGLASNVIGGVQTAISGVYDALSGVATTITSSISNLATTFTQTVTSITTSISSMASNLGASLSSMGQSLGTAITSSIQGVTEYLTSLTQSITSNLQGIATSLAGSFTGISEYLSSFGSTLSDIIGSMQEYLSGIGDTLASQFTQIYENLSSFGTTMIDAVTGIKDWISDGFITVGTTMTSLIDAVSEIILDLPSWFEDIWTWISGGFEAMGTKLTGWWSEINTYFGKQYSNLLAGTNDVIRSLTGFINPLIDIKFFFTNQFTKFIDAMITFLKDPFGSMSNFFKPVIDFFTDPINKLIDRIKGGFADVAGAFKPVTDFLKPVIDIKNFFTNQFTKFIDSSITFLKDPFGSMSNFFKPVMDFFKDPLDRLIEKVSSGMANISGAFKGLSFQGLSDTFKGWKEPLENIGKMGQYLTMFQNPASFLLASITWGKADMMPDLLSGMKSMGTQIGKGAKSLWDSCYDGLETAFDSISEAMGKMTKKMVSRADKQDGIMKEVFGNLLGNYFFGPLMLMPMEMAKLMIGMVFPPEGKAVKKPEEVMTAMGGMLFSALSLPYAISNFLMFIGDNLKFTFGIKPLGVGGNMRVDIGSVVKHLGKIVWRIPDVLIGSLAYGFGIWISQPVAKVLNAYARNMIPIEMPDIQEIRVMANRASALKGKFPKMYDQVADSLRMFMAYYGWSDAMIEWNLGFSTKMAGGALKDLPKYLETTIEDRFKDTLKIPLALRWSVPTGSELSRMMIRDVILEYPMFTKIMKLQGFAPDVSRLYYLLHYRYPTPEHLWTLYRRGMAGMLWYKKGDVDFPEKRAGIFAQGLLNPKSPVDFNMNESVFQNMIESYMKWHDYAPFSWQVGWPADRHIIVDLMADIPQRIDARWLYKWSIIPDGKLDASVVESVFNVVRARGVHPRWEEKITVSECMNAMQEERSYARTGILNALERGFTTSESTFKKLDKLTTVEILGKEWPVRFLDGEQKLLVLRSMWDRALMVLNRLWSHLLMGYQRNIYSQADALRIIDRDIHKFGSLLHIDLKIDEPYLHAWIDTFTVRHEIERVQRIRYWMRIFIYRATQLAESGEAFEDLVNDFCDLARLTDVERELMIKLGTAFINVSRRKTKLTIVKKLVLGKVRSGTWTLAKGLEKLIEGGMSKEDAQAFLEADVKTRLVSTDKLISMSEKIPISPTLLKAKMDAEGVPPDEQALYTPYAVATEISQEQGRVVTEIITDYVDGLYDEVVLRSKMDAVATLDGKVQEELGVAWVNYSPMERHILMDLAKKRRERRTSPSQKIKTISSDKLISLMENVPIDKAKLKAKMQAENIPEDEQALYMSNALASEISEEIGRIATELVTDFADGLLDEATMISELNRIATLDGTVKDELGVDWIVLSPEERKLFLHLAKMKKARKLKPSYKVKTVSSDKLVSMMENIPIDPLKFKAKMDAENIPVDEQKLYVQNALASEIAEEIGRLATEIVTDFANGMYDSPTKFRKALDDVATLGGAVPQLLKIPWLVLSPVERSLLVNLGKLKRQRVLWKELKPST